MSEEKNVLAMNGKQREKNGILFALVSCLYETQHYVAHESERRRFSRLFSNIFICALFHSRPPLIWFVIFLSKHDSHFW